jgi:hypothetical protein
MTGRSSLIITATLLLVGCQSSPGLSDPLESNVYVPILPDPDPNAGPRFSPSSATAVTAFAGTKLDDVTKPHDCTALSPCAAPPPALSAISSPTELQKVSGNPNHRTRDG